MKRLTVSVDDIAFLRYVFNDHDFDPTQFAILCEVAGASGISATFPAKSSGVSERDIKLLKQLHKTFFNLHLPLNPESLKIALTLSPDMVTFVDLQPGDPVKLAPLPAYQIEESLSSSLPDFHANGISVAVYCEPEISILKTLSKLEIDYVEFDCTGYTRASDSNEELVGLDKLNSATMAAAKLGFGINCFGNIDYYHLSSLAAIPRLEDICMGEALLKRSFLVGVNQAIAEAKQEILFHHQE
ncbi:MAG: hypothetical protein D6748_00580 [Calditrichaeota bacterium]|nr:MAG: hypothetical protein D6748_00580 [Calditrichota bacterium]